jgi:hypothetical protein
VSFKSDATDREAGAAIPVPNYWKTYTTTTDTFQRITPPDEEEQG